MKEPTILLVEDNPDDEELTLIAFKSCLFPSHIVVTHDGVEALDYLFGTGKFTGRDVSSVPKLVLLDLKLPRLNGLEVLQRLRKEPTTQLVPVIILTSSNEVEDIISSYKFGANSYIRKQVEFESFANTIIELGTYWLSINQTVAY
jgi:two-component system, response regulator